MQGLQRLWKSFSPAARREAGDTARNLAIAHEVDLILSSSPREAEGSERLENMLAGAGRVLTKAAQDAQREAVLNHDFMKR